MKTTPILSALSFLTAVASAIHIPIVGRSLQKRDSSVQGDATLTDTNDVQYSANITLGGKPFSVLIDTGSADLWVASDSPIPGAVNTGAKAGVQYAVGSVEGPIQTAPLVFAGHTVPHQAYIFVTPGSTNIAGSGLIGLGPSTGSNILYTLNNNSIGNTPLDSIFLQDLTTPNFISILLGRSDEPGHPFPGDITVGEILPGYESVTSQPQLDVNVVSLADYGNQHWQTLLDPSGVIGPDGKAISISSVVTTNTNPQQLLAVFDSGFSLPQVPKAAADAFYSNYPGAAFVNLTGLGGIWTLPCVSEVNVAFDLGGKTYHVHPLDAVMDPTDVGFKAFQNSQGANMCFGAFQPISFDTGNLYDMILGMAFLRNVYIYINFGDFILGTPNRAKPYIQLLSTTNDTAAAHRDFVTARGGSVNPYSNSPTNSPSVSWLKAHRTLIIAIIACAVGGLVMFALAFFLCCKKAGGGGRGAYGTKAYGSYAPLNAPAPAPATDVHMPPPGQPAWQPQYSQPQYSQPQYSQPYNEPWGPKY